MKDGCSRSSKRCGRTKTTLSSRCRSSGPARHAFHSGERGKGAALRGRGPPHGRRVRRRPVADDSRRPDSRSRERSGGAESHHRRDRSSRRGAPPRSGRRFQAWSRSRNRNRSLRLSRSPPRPTGARSTATGPRDPRDHDGIHGSQTDQRPAVAAQGNEIPFKTPAAPKPQPKPPAAKPKKILPAGPLWFPSGKPGEAPAGKMDELAFLKSVTGNEGATAPAQPGKRPSGGFTKPVETAAPSAPAAPPHRHLQRKRRRIAPAAEPPPRRSSAASAAP